MFVRVVIFVLSVFHDECNTRVARGQYVSMVTDSLLKGFRTNFHSRLIGLEWCFMWQTLHVEWKWVERVEGGGGRVWL